MATGSYCPASYTYLSTEELAAFMESATAAGIDFTQQGTRPAWMQFVDCDVAASRMLPTNPGYLSAESGEETFSTHELSPPAEASLLPPDDGSSADTPHTASEGEFSAPRSFEMAPEISIGPSTELESFHSPSAETSSRGEASLAAPSSAPEDLPELLDGSDPQQQEAECSRVSCASGDVQVHRFSSEDAAERKTEPGPNQHLYGTVSDDDEEGTVSEQDEEVPVLRTTEAGECNKEPRADQHVSSSSICDEVEAPVVSPPEQPTELRARQHSSDSSAQAPSPIPSHSVSPTGSADVFQQRPAPRRHKTDSVPVQPERSPIRSPLSSPTNTVKISTREAAVPPHKAQSSPLPRSPASTGGRPRRHPMSYAPLISPKGPTAGSAIGSRSPPAPPPAASCFHQYTRSVRSMLTDAAVKRPSVLRVLRATHATCRAMLWVAVATATLWLWGAMLGWLMFAAAWLLSKWAAVAAARYAVVRVRHGCAALLLGAVSTAFQIPSISYKLTTAIMSSVLCTCWAGIRCAANTGATTAQSWYDDLASAVAVAAERVRAVAVQIRDTCAAAAAAVVRCAACCVAWVGGACVRTAKVAQSGACVVFGVSAWLTCMWVSALCWGVLMVREFGKTVSSVVRGYAVPLSSAARAWARPHAQKV
eukprot:jgi/Ulvmu1/6545/UM003_0179.1